MKSFHIVLLAAALVLSACGSGQTQSQTQKLVVDSNSNEYVSLNQEGMQRICDFVNGCDCYFIATMDGDQPRVRPFGTFEIIEGKLYIQTGHVKNVAKQIAANPKVEICAYNGSQWVRIAATLVEEARVEIKAAMLELNPSLKSMYSAEDANTALYYLKDATATVNSFTTDPETVQF